MNQIKTEYDRLFIRYGPPIKPPRPWKRTTRKLNTSTAHPAKVPALEKKQLNAPVSREQKSV